MQKRITGQLSHIVKEQLDSEAQGTLVTMLTLKLK
jgi:hypothetical protein